MRAALAVPGLISAVSWYDGLRGEQRSLNMIQALRDYFGAHGYERVDRSGSFHTDWPQSVSSAIILAGYSKPLLSADTISFSVTLGFLQRAPFFSPFTWIAFLAK
jgi:hypothetical protein